MRRAVVVLAVLTVMVCPFAASQLDKSVVLVNGRIYTGNEKNDVVEAIYVSRGKIAAVGKTATILKRSTPGTQVIELSGRTVVPGFIDSHAHLMNLGMSLSRLDLVGTQSYQEVVDKVAEAVKDAEPGSWILGRGWDQNDWAENDFPTHALLSAASPSNPVILTRIDGHATLVNAEAMRLAGLDANTSAPDGGRIVRDAEGLPTGVLIDRASGLVTLKIPAPSKDDKLRAIRRAIRHCTSLGITTVHDAGVSREDIELYKELIDFQRFKFRVYAMLQATKFEDFRSFTAFLREDPLVGYGQDQLSVRAVKVMADGALGSRGAALFEPYSDEPGSTGLMITPPQQLNLITNIATSQGYQVATHAIGDRANSAVLDAYANAMKARNAPRDPRFRIEHAQIMRPQDIKRMGNMKVIASIQATHATSDMPWAEQRVGSKRLAGAYAWRTMLDENVVIANGSDFPVESADPLWGIYASVTRQDHSGNPGGGWRAAQRMSREEALRSFTMGGAYAGFEEDTKGSIEVGKWADLVILNKDIMTVSPQEILQTRVLATLIGGEVVYQRGK